MKAHPGSLTLLFGVIGYIDMANELREIMNEQIYTSFSNFVVIRRVYTCYFCNDIWL